MIKSLLFKGKLFFSAIWDFMLHKNAEKLSYFFAVAIGVPSLIALAKPALFEMFRGHYAEIHASVVESTSKNLSLVISNNGNSPVAVKSVQIVLVESSAEIFSPQSIPLSVGDRLIKPNEAVIVSTPESKISLLPWKSEMNVIKHAALKSLNRNSVLSELKTIKCALNIEYVVPGNEAKIYTEYYQCYNSCPVY